MLNVRSRQCLANILGVTESKLYRTLGILDKSYQRFELIDPDKPGKRRDILSIKGDWRFCLDGLYPQLLLPRRKPSEYSHGGIKGRSIISNAAPHRESAFVYTVDISNFFPSIHYTRVYDLFVGR